MQPQDPQQSNMQPEAQPTNQPPSNLGPSVSSSGQAPVDPRAPVHAPSPTAEPAQPQKKFTLKIILLVLAVLFGFNILSGVVFYVYNKSHQAPKTNDAVVAMLQQKPVLAAADLRAISKEDAFYAYVKYAAQEKKVVITKAFYFSDDGMSKGDDRYSKVGVDYEAKKIVYAYESDFEGRRDRTRCYDGIQDDYSAIAQKWERNADATSCKKDKLYSATTDGFNAGGLSADQAETFVSYLRSHAGLLAVKNLELADHNGKQYLHFTVTMNQIEVKGTKFAAQWLMFAFKQTGLNPEEYPYGYAGAGGEGFMLEYYVDPATGLPAYSELTALAAPGDTSGNKTGDYRYRVQYDFTVSTFDATPKNNTNIAVTW